MKYKSHTLLWIGESVLLSVQLQRVTNVVLGQN